MKTELGIRIIRKAFNGYCDVVREMHLHTYDDEKELEWLKTERKRIKNYLDGLDEDIEFREANQQKRQSKSI